MHPFQLRRYGLGVLPILDSVIKRMGLERNLIDALGNARYAQAILLLVKNIVVERNALYAIGEWAASYDPALVYGGLFGDDVLARALDRLFDTDRASLLTRVVLQAVKADGVDLSQIHQDTTSVKLYGAYQNQWRQAVRLVRGYSKDHRPDLRQLVYELSVTHDGAIPVLFKAHDGNRTDDSLHWENWQMLRGLLGRSDFLYVADSKLCVSETMLKIDGNQGRFITIVPRTRGEVDDFQAKVETSLVRWQKVFAKRSSRKHRRIDLYEVASGIYQLQEGFRLYWFRSSEKARRDWNEREDKIASAMEHLRVLADPERKKKTTSEPKLRKQADAILARFAVQAWVKVEIVLEEVVKFRQLTPGRASASTVYRKVVRWLPRLSFSRDEDAIARAELMDGIFPLTTNTDLDAKAVLCAYKYQPNLEKRHALLKSGLQVAPIFLKKNVRIEALMFVYFLAQLVCALLERQLRNAMRESGISQIQILPEDRPSATPTTEQVVRVFNSRARQLLFSKDGQLVQTFVDPLTPIQEQILNLLAISPKAYA
ncbi:MAG: IS1634 family transposase [Acidobacteria bacterium]|nr:MAG: IS1634 family transposase [Acidobacteriota bacterium]